MSAVTNGAFHPDGFSVGCLRFWYETGLTKGKRYIISLGIQ